MLSSCKIKSASEDKLIFFKLNSLFFFGLRTTVLLLLPDSLFSLESDLNSGNIGYKLIQRIGGWQVIGPILQGMAAPVNDLSRGCTIDEIVNLVAITSLQS